MIEKQQDKHGCSTNGKIDIETVLHQQKNSTNMRPRPNVPPSPCHFFCEHTTQKGSSNAHHTEDCAYNSHVRWNFGGLDDECDNRMATASHTSTSHALDGSTISVVLLGDTADLESVHIIIPI